MQHDVRAFERAQRPERQQLRITGACADKVDMARAII